MQFGQLQPSVAATGIRHASPQDRMREALQRVCLTANCVWDYADMEPAA